MNYIKFILFLSLSTNAWASPFAQADAVLGKQLVEKNCIACHATRFDDNGDGASMYLRKDRKVNNASALLTQVRTCNTNLSLQWFEEDELNVARYLNQTYYKFAQ